MFYFFLLRFFLQCRVVRKTNVKSTNVFFSKHCVLSGGTQRRAFSFVANLDNTGVEILEKNEIVIILDRWPECLSK